MLDKGSGPLRLYRSTVRLLCVEVTMVEAHAFFRRGGVWRCVYWVRRYVEVQCEADGRNSGLSRTLSKGTILRGSEVAAMADGFENIHHLLDDLVSRARRPSLRTEFTSSVGSDSSKGVSLGFVPRRMFPVEQKYLKSHEEQL